MAAQSAARTVHATLTAATVDTVALTGAGYEYVEVINRATTGAGISVTAGTNAASSGLSGPAGNGVPTVGGARTVLVPPGRSRMIPLSGRTTGTAVQVAQLISATGDAYTVNGHAGLLNACYADRPADA